MMTSFEPLRPALWTLALVIVLGSTSCSSSDTEATDDDWAGCDAQGQSGVDVEGSDGARHCAYAAALFDDARAGLDGVGSGGARIDPSGGDSHGASPCAPTGPTPHYHQIGGGLGVCSSEETLEPHEREEIFDGVEGTPLEPECRAQDGEVLDPGTWGGCGGFSSACDETGTQSRTQQVCWSGQSVDELDSQECMRNTDGQSCGAGRSCSNGMCQTSCMETTYWSPSEGKARDPGGTQFDQEIATRLEVELRDDLLEGRLVFRLCKFEGGAPSNFFGDDLDVRFTDDTATVVLDTDISAPPDQPCTSWFELTPPNTYSEGDRLEGQLRVISPAFVASGWNDDCTTQGDTGGTCWLMTTPSMTRTCR